MVEILRNQGSSIDCHGMLEFNKVKLHSAKFVVLRTCLRFCTRQFNCCLHWMVLTMWVCSHGPNHVY